MDLEPLAKQTPAHAKMLEVAYERLLGAHGNLEAVRMQEVVEASGLTSGAFYNVWPGGLKDFRRSLLAYALDASRDTYVDDMLDAMEGIDPEEVPLTELVRGFAAADSTAIVQDPTFVVQVAMWARHSEDPDAAALLGEIYRQFGARYAAVYDGLIARYGRRWKEPFTAQRFATVLTALAEGTALRRAVDPQGVPLDLADPRDPDKPWDLYGLAVVGLVTVATESAKTRVAKPWSFLDTL
jgi:AcrR family transcriptional regulator